MKTFFSLSILVLFGTIAGFGQRIYFCDNYTSSGEPIGANTKVSCPAEGGYIYFLYQNGVNNLTNGNYYINVDKLTGDNYVPFDVKTVVSDPLKNWFVHDYKFMTAGDYRITVKNSALQEMAKDYLSLVPSESQSSSSTSSYNFDDPASTFYYTYSKVEASTSVNSITGEIPAAYTTFNIDASLGGRIYFKVSNEGKAIGTDKFIVYIDKMDEAGEYKTHDTKTYDLTNKNATWAQFYYDFYSSGEYSITVYSTSMVFINTVKITLNYKQ
ncbi:MAG: hypothetical protein JW731_07865 [Bacteroidales bacterium]|nr:hypothetical protein [Bacteroidales bacterium]